MIPAQKTIVWDWNGTLLDDTDAVLSSINQVLGSVKRDPISLDILRETQTRPLDKFYRALGLSEEEIPQALKGERTIFHDTYEPLATHALLRVGAVDILHALKKNNVNNLILSNHLVDEIIRLLKQHDIYHYFKEIMAYSSRETQYRDMTKGERLNHYISTHKLDPKNTIIIGDTEEEIKIGQELNMASIAITGGIHSEARLYAMRPDHLIHSLTELIPILQRREFVS